MSPSSNSYISTVLQKSSTPQQKTSIKNASPGQAINFGYHGSFCGLAIEIELNWLLLSSIQLHPTISLWFNDPNCLINICYLCAQWLLNWLAWVGSCSRFCTVDSNANCGAWCGLDHKFEQTWSKHKICKKMILLIEYWDLPLLVNFLHFG